MKKLLFNRDLMFVIMALLLLCSSVVAQDEAPYKLYTMGSWVTDEKVTEHYGALSYGAVLNLGNGWSVRAALRTINIGGGDDLKAVDLSGMKNFHVGKDYYFYLTAGLADNTSDYYQGLDDFGGFGFSKTIWTLEGGDTDGGIDVFIEAIGFDVEGNELERTNYGQINIGFTIARPM